MQGIPLELLRSGVSYKLITFDHEIQKHNENFGNVCDSLSTCIHEYNGELICTDIMMIDFQRLGQIAIILTEMNNNTTSYH